MCIRDSFPSPLLISSPLPISAAPRSGRGGSAALTSWPRQAARRHREDGRRRRHRHQLLQGR
eukprot:2947175-Rhodomonas_salina.4